MIGVAMYITIKSLWERHKNKSMIAKTYWVQLEDHGQSNKRSKDRKNLSVKY